jgi:hypothetical protein
MMLRNKKAQSSMELLITLSFGLVILIPVVVLALIQISSSTSSLSTTQAQAAANKLASVALAIGVQGYPARQAALIEVPPDVQNIYVGTQSNLVGHVITFVVATSSGSSYVNAYTPVNVSGYLENIVGPGTYLVNVSYQNSCPSVPSVSCVYMTAT